MGSARGEIEKAARGEGCLGRAHPDEPVFVLRAQDALFSETVRFWADRAAGVGCLPAKVRGARETADRGDEWSPKKNPD
jgi:hypothetical protein